MSDSNGAGYPPQPEYTPPPGQGVPLAPLNTDQSAAPFAPGAHPPPAAPAQAFGMGAVPGQPGAVPAPGYGQPGFPQAGPPMPPAPGYPVQPAPGYPMQPGYPIQSAPGYPMQTAPGYPASPVGYPTAQPGYPVSPPGFYGYAPPSGRRFWGFQFLVLIPYFGAIVAVIVSLTQRATTRTSPFPIVRENARWAANWSLSFLLYVIALYALIIIVGISTSTSTYDSYGSYSSTPSAWISLPVILVFGIGIYCLVTMIRGCVVSDRVVHRPALAIPFFRA